MAFIHDLPPEVLREICILVLLKDQFSLRRLEDFEADLDSKDSVLEEFNAFRTHSLRKILVGTFIEGLEAVHVCKAGGAGADLLHYHCGLYQELGASRIMRDDILALSSTSKGFRDVAREQLWRVVELGQGDEKGIDDVHGVLESVWKTPDLAQLVRSLSFRSSGIKAVIFSDVEMERQLGEWTRVVNQLFVLKASPDDVDLSSCMKTWNVWLRLALLVLLLPNLRNLKLFIDLSGLSEVDLWIEHIEDPSNDSTQSISDLFANRLKTLQEFSLIIEDPDDDSLNSRVLDFPFMLPSLKTVYFGNTFANDASLDGDTPVQEKYCRTSAVTSLTIEQSLMSIESLTELLQFPKALESFTFSYGGPSNHLSTAEAVEICRALLPHRNSLRKLRIIGYHDLREEEQAPVGSLMTEFPILEDIAIPVALLQTAELSSTFPRSAQKLRLYLYDEWTMQECANQIHRLLGRKRDGLVYPCLKEIWIEYWYSSESTLTIIDSGWLVGIQRMMEDMIMAGREAGVKLEFDVDETSKSAIWN